MSEYEDPIAEFIEASAQGLCTAYIVIANIERINGDQSFWVTTLIVITGIMACYFFWLTR